jgi:hypothetical protein
LDYTVDRTAQAYFCQGRQGNHKTTDQCLVLGSIINRFSSRRTVLTAQLLGIHQKKIISFMRCSECGRYASDQRSTLVVVVSPWKVAVRCELEFLRSFVLSLLTSHLLEIDSRNE